MALATALTACGGGDSSNSTVAEQVSTSSAGAEGGSAEASRQGSAQFRTPEGDNSIQSSGREASPSELAAAEAALDSYLEAREKGEVREACAYLAEDTVSQLEELVARSPQFEGKTDCASIFTALVADLPASARANPMSDGLGALRVEGGRGFALFRGPGGAGYFIQMIDEDGQWKVGAIAPSELP